MVPATVNVRELPFVIQASYYAEMPNLRRDQGQKGGDRNGKSEERRTQGGGEDFVKIRKLFVRIS